jgi:hypothetical protein
MTLEQCRAILVKGMAEIALGNGIYSQKSLQLSLRGLISFPGECNVVHFLLSAIMRNCQEGKKASSFFLIHLFICAYIVWAISCPPLIPWHLPLPPNFLASRQNLFCPTHKQ